MTDLSILIPSRNEMFLKNTIEDILAHSRLDTEVIAVLDGQWSDPPVVDHPKVTIIYHSQSIGQRAATNEAARMAMGRYVMKCDAHCSFAPGFDEVLLADMQDDWTVVPVMRNLHAFDWICPNGHRRYQGPSGPCQECGQPMEREMVWIAKPSPQSTAYRFRPDLHFEYFNEFKRRPEGQGDLTETMSLQGSCFLMTKAKYHELNVCDEAWGSWGNQGTEVACKTWLSGGRVICNHKTYYAHCFRTQGGDFSFPYPIDNRQVEHARRCSRDLFLNNKWEKQIYPLSWLVKKFWPVPGWTEEDLCALDRLDSSSKFSTFITSASSGDGVRRSELVAADAEILSTVGGGRSVSSHNILSGENKNEVGGIAATPIVADVIKDRNIRAFSDGDGTNEPCINKAMDIDSLVMETGIPIAIGTDRAIPQPASSSSVKIYAGKDLGGFGGSDICDNEVGIHMGIISPNKEISKGILYYTDNRLDPLIFNAVQQSILHSVNGHELVSVSLKPLDFGRNIVLPLERGYLTMSKQILAGLEALDTDIVFMVEHDVFYAPGYFDFNPPMSDIYYYNTNVWHVRASDGHALYYTAKLLSQLCAYRYTLIEHYRQRVINTERALAEYGDTYAFRNWIRRQGFEPGSHGRVERVDDLKSETWVAERPNLDIRHDQNLTPSRWSKDQFRDQRNCRDWKEADYVPGWYAPGEFAKLLEGQG